MFTAVVQYSFVDIGWHKHEDLGFIILYKFDFLLIMTALLLPLMGKMDYNTIL